MAKKSAVRRSKTHRKPHLQTLGGQAAENTILLGLAPQEHKAVSAKMRLVRLPTHTVLNEMDVPIEFGYFINSGLASILNVMSDGKSVEVGLCGFEGFIGLPLIVGFETSPTRTIMQVEGSGFQISARDLKELLPRCPQLEKSLNRYSQVLALQVTQVAACNRLHEVDERLARWLLMSEDRVGRPFFTLTQEFLAHMLGTRRASVTVAAGILQKAGLISYQRGQVTISDRARLEAAACECYEQLNQHLLSWRNNHSR
jgi:CRP-like cAMP-binding protein